MTTHLVDSDVLIGYLKGTVRANAILAPFPLTTLGVSIITVGEVLEGVYYGGNTLTALRGLRSFTRSVPMFDVDERVIRRYARITGALRQQGQLIPAPDLFIAATAITHGLTLISRNRRHFARVPGLTLHP